MWCTFLALQISLTLILTTNVFGYQFDHDSCKSMHPNYKRTGVQVTEDPHKGHHHRRNAGEDTAAEDEDDENTSETSDQLKPGIGDVPFKVAVSDNQYRRNRQLQVSIQGPEFNGFMVQAKSTVSTPAIVGVFENLPASATTLNCDSPFDTVIHKDTGGKGNLTFTWRAPDDDVGKVTFMVTVIQKNLFWSHIHSPVVNFNSIPPSLKECGKTESCYRQSSKPDCSPDECDYIVITKLTEPREIEFTIGGKVTGQNGYIAVGFTMDNKNLMHMDISACIKNDTVVDTQQFLVDDWAAGVRHYHKQFTVKSEEIDGDMIWCKFRRSLQVPDLRLADLTQSLHQTFFTGAINESSLDIILPPIENINFLAEPWNHENNVVVMHLVSVSAADILSATLAMSLSALIFIILTYF